MARAHRPGRDGEMMVGPGAGGGVVRQGDTVLRPGARTSSGMIATLRHLDGLGFDHAPHYLGPVETPGAQQPLHAFEFVPGDVATTAGPVWATTDELLASVAVLVRRLHDAVATTDWLDRDLSWGHPPPARYRGVAPCHLDVSPANVVCRDGRAHALIDFEEVALADPVWDIARAARHWIPLIDPHDLAGDWRAVDGAQSRRLRLFADAYGADRRIRTALVDAVLANADSTYERMRVEAAAGNPGYLAQWQGGHAQRNRRGRDWVLDHHDELACAVGG